MKTGMADMPVKYKIWNQRRIPNVFFAVSSEIYERISEAAPDLLNRITDIGPDHELVEGITDGLNTLSSNLG